MIKVLTLGQYTGPTFGLPEMEVATKAAVAAANSAGGINGSTIDLITCDDKGDPNTASACAREAVQDKVAAVLGSITLYGDDVTAILGAADIPYIGALPNAASDTSSPIAYPLDSGSPGGVNAITSFMIKNDGCKKVGIVSEANNPAQNTVNALAKTAITLAGATPLPPVYISATAPDLTPNVATLESSGAGCAFLDVFPSDIVKIVGAVRQSSQPKFLLGVFAADLAPQIVTALKGEANGIVASNGAFLPGAKTPTFLAQMKAEDPSAALSSNAEVAWSAATAFVEIAQQISGAVTPSSVLAQIQKTSALMLETYPAPINLSTPNTAKGYTHLFNTNGIVYTIENGQFVLSTPTPFNAEGVIQASS